MKKDYRILIEHILECINLIEKYIGNITEEDFLINDQLQDAVIRRIEIIGEAVKNIPEDLKRKYPDIPWKRISGMRDVIVHDYFKVDLNLTWQVAKVRIKELKEQINKIK